MSQVPTNSNVYYREQYWNDHHLTLDQFNRIVADVPYDGPMPFWMDHVKRHYFSKAPAQKALFINCGNGWAERDLYDKGIFSYGVGFDYSEKLLAEAREKARHRSIEYICSDCNLIDFPENSFDLIVNVAAMHHVQYIDRMNRLLSKVLMPNGIFVNFDYVGPHRNQYSTHHFEAMKAINQALPNALQNKELSPAHLETMLAVDPTEAIHSELVLSMFERYFIPIDRKDLNGAIAYQILYNNTELLDLHTPAVEQYVQSLLELDELYTVHGDLPPLFSFYVGKPRKSILKEKALLEKFTNEEAAREEYASQHGGRYY